MDVGAKIATAKKAGYSDAEITAFLSKDAALGPKVQAARKAGFGDADIVGHLTGGGQSAPTRARTDAQRRVKSTPGPVRAVSQAATLGYSDEIDAGVAALETGANNFLNKVRGKPSVGYGMRDAYDAVVTEERAAQKGYAQKYPAPNMAYSLIGGVGAPGTGAAGRFVGASRSLAGATVRSGAVGAAAGAVAGAGTAEGGAKDRAVGAAKGAAVGATVGAALPSVARGAQTAGRAINAATGYRLSGGVQGAAASRLREALRQDGVDEATIRTRVSEWARTGAMPPTLADVAGENTRALLRTAGSRPGPARNAAQTYRNETVEGVPDASIERARQLTPNEPRPAGVVQAGIEEGRDTAARVQYREPYAAPVQIDAQTATALRGDAGRAAIQRARQAAAARRDNQQVQELDSLLAENMNEFPQVSAGTLDRIRIAMGERATTATQRNARDMAGGLRSRAADIDTALDDVDGLAEARGSYRGSSQAIEAVDIGQRILKDPPDVFAASLTPDNPQALDAARVGARQAITDALGQRANASPVLRQIAFAPNARRNLEALFGPDEAERFIAAARQNIQKGENANFIAPNTGSQTQLRDQDQGTIASVFNAVRAPVQAILNRLASGLTLSDDEAQVLLRLGLDVPNPAAARAPANPIRRAVEGSTGRTAAVVPNLLAQ